MVHIGSVLKHKFRLILGRIHCRMQNVPGILYLDGLCDSNNNNYCTCLPYEIPTTTSNPLTLWISTCNPW
jgi:hypothetical protein